MTNKALAITITGVLMSALLTLSCFNVQAATTQCTCRATTANLVVERAARISPALDGAELHYGAPGKCKAEMSDDGNEIRGSFRSKVDIRSLRTKKRSVENDVVWFSYDRTEGASLTTNYVSAGKDAAEKIISERTAQKLTMQVKQDVRYAPSDLTVPYTLRKGNKVDIALTCPSSIGQ